ncbi:HS12A-like protein [Mya arenaria]|uniref:HS12A-like protein n=1 Tax=Mya arenaria TaxID=6604 RepID=A0ABY7EQ21_MYAAR|nr:HS12A-like protein [Mya arenaria]
MSREEHVVVAAIDFGSTYSGYAFQFRGSDKICSLSTFSGSTVTYKAPTVILFDKDKNFNSFGYQKLRAASTVKDDQGQKMKIVDVFGGAIKYLKDELMGELLTHAPNFEEKDVKWLITVPAIWDDAAKQIMFKAAEKAGISPAHFVFEPEAAAIFCKNEYETADDPRQKDIFKANCNFILIDLGGGTVDVTAHKVNDDGTLDALMPPSGGPWGGNNVNRKFFELLENIFGAEVFRRFSAEEMDERLELERSFEVKKRLDGAVLYGLDESVIRSHRMPYTVGIDSSVPFEEGIHPEQRRNFQNGSYKCTDIFKVFIKRGERIQPDLESATYEVRATNPEEAVIELYKTDRDDTPTYTSDCTLLEAGSEMSRDEHMVVAAIDFGTTYSGYAFKFRGSDKAENMYAKLAEETNHKGWRYFRWFKMDLQRGPTQKKLRVTTTLRDDQGQPMNIIDVFGGALKYLKDELMETLLASAPRTEEKDVKWTITVPAIWDDAAKQIMVLAAEKAGIAFEHLQLVYEPEAAAIYSINEYSTAYDPRQRDIFKTDSNFILIDLGGGTVDITAHKVNVDGTLDALMPPSGGPWGGYNLLEDLFGAKVLQKFSREEKDELLELERTFEVKKRQDGQFSLKLPARLIELAGVTQVQESQQAMKVSYRRDKLFIKAKAVLDIFKETIEHTIVQVSELLQKTDLQNVSTIVLVGGFAESKIFQQMVKSHFDSNRYLLIIPQAPELAVLKGIDTSVEFEEGRHPEKLRVFQNGSFKCSGIFKVFIERGTQIEPIMESAMHEFRTPSSEEAVIELYKTDRDAVPTYIEDCKRLGESLMQYSCNVTK